MKRSSKHPAQKHPLSPPPSKRQRTRNSPSQRSSRPSHDPHHPVPSHSSRPRDHVSASGLSRQADEYPKIEGTAYKQSLPLNRSPFPLALPNWLEQPTLVCIYPAQTECSSCLIVVPSLPILFDPIFFHDLFAAELSPPTGGSDQEWKRIAVVSDYFRTLAYIGDKWLSDRISRILVELFPSSICLVNLLHEDLVSNKSWSFLSIVYRMDCFVESEVLVKHMQVGIQRAEGWRIVKFWADCFEAYFGSLVLERELLWKDDEQDMRLFVRKLIILKYQDLFHLSHFSIEERTAVVENNAISQGTAWRDDELLVRILGHGARASPNAKIGYWAIHSEQRTDRIPGIDKSMRFRTDSSDTAAELLHNQLALRRKLWLKPMMKIPETPSTPESETRQRLFNLLTDGWFPNQHLQDRQELTIANLHCLRRNFIMENAADNLFENSLVALSFWYEASLAYWNPERVIDTLLCVIIYAIHDMPRNRVLLQRCIYNIEEAFVLWRRTADVPPVEDHNVMLRVAEDPPFQHGLLLFCGRPMISWGSSSDDDNMVIRNAVVALMSPKQRKRKKEEYNVEQQN